MRRAVLLLAVPLMACATTSIEPPDVPYLEQAPTRQTFESPLAVAEHLVGNYPESLEAGPTLRLNVLPSRDVADRLELRIRIDPVLDDSIAAEEWRATLSQSGSGWTIETLGLRRKCARGPDIGNWGPFICP